MEQWTEVRRRVLTGELSKRAACRQYQLHWRTLEKMLAHDEPPGYQRRQPVRRPKIDPFLTIIHQILQDDRQAPKKQRHTAWRIFQRLVDEHQFTAFVADQYSHVRIQYRTPQQLGLLERFHATLKSEEVYWRLYDHPQHCRACLAEFRERYNMRRPHWALVPEAGGDPWVPYEVYAEGKTIQIPRWQTWAVAAKAKLEELLDKAVA